MFTKTIKNMKKSLREKEMSADFLIFFPTQKHSLLADFILIIFLILF